jgi:hypothetical protein
VRCIIVAVFLLAWTAHASADAEIIPIGGGAFCVIYAKVVHSCTHLVNKEKGTGSALCKGTIAAGEDNGTFVLAGKMYPSANPPIRSGSTPLLECNAGTNVDWRGCTISGRNDRANGAVRYSAVCGLCE